MTDDQANNDTANQSADRMSIAVLGDIHLYRTRVAPWRLLNKRMLGMINLWLKRRHRFDPALLPAVFEQINAVKPARMLMTGDVSTTALPEEFADTMEALKLIDASIPITAIPGNHDRYTYASTRRQYFEQAMQKRVPAVFPHFEKLNDAWHLLALDASLPRKLTARGWLGKEQLKTAHAYLQTLDASQGVVVMCHYPAFQRDGDQYTWNHLLVDMPALQAVLRDSPARVLHVHGHEHEPWFYPVPSSAGDGFAHMIDINAGAPVMKTRQHPFGQGFCELQLPAIASQPVSYVHHFRDAAGDWTTKVSNN